MGLYVCQFDLDRPDFHHRFIMVYEAANREEARWFPTAYELLTELRRGEGIGNIKEVTLTSQDIGRKFELPDNTTKAERNKIYNKLEKLFRNTTRDRLEDFLFYR